MGDTIRLDLVSCTCDPDADDNATLTLEGLDQDRQQIVIRATLDPAELKMINRVTGQAYWTIVQGER